MVLKTIESTSDESFHVEHRIKPSEGGRRVLVATKAVRSISTDAVLMRSAENIPHWWRRRALALFHVERNKSF